MYIFQTIAISILGRTVWEETKEMKEGEEVIDGGKGVMIDSGLAINLRVHEGQFVGGLVLNGALSGWTMQGHPRELEIDNCKVPRNEINKPNSGFNKREVYLGGHIERSVSYRME